MLDLQPATRALTDIVVGVRDDQLATTLRGLRC